MISAFITLLVIAFVALIVKSLIKPHNYPPGPTWYPFIGCSSEVKNMSKKHGSQWQALSQLAKRYSTQVLGLKLGSELVVAVYGEKNIRQVFTGLEFEGRPNSFFLRLRCLGKKLGITFTDGPLWREHRSFTVKQLRNVGFGKSAMEKDIQGELRKILMYIKNNENPMSPRKIMAKSVMNVLWKYVAGECIEEERLNSLLELLHARSKAFAMAGGWLNQFPWTRFIIPEKSGYTLIKKINDEISKIIEEAIQKHKNKSVEGSDYIYSFTEEMNQNKTSFTEEQLKTICLDLLIAGSQTTSNTLEFALLAALRHKNIQQRIHDEISNVIGNNIPCWADHYRLTYTSAFLLEVQRFYTVVPIAGPRRVLETTTIDGYTIPKETTVIIATGDLHCDPELWEDPHTFNPDRFINANGTLTTVEHMYPFGLGRRRCPGDALAKSFIFITFVGIMQQYSIECRNGTYPSNNPVIGILSAPEEYAADFIPKHQTSQK
ncbi:cytochrome p450 domain-containing protein [Phthorimaea operculella]|nr:cytochrome p450 domain-containing protein [Phthorimaea operculella]